MMTWRRLLLPAGVDAAAGPLLVARALRAFADGYMAILLPAYLLALGLGTLEVGVVATATMLGSALATVAVGAWGHRFRSSRLLRGAALLMALTGVGFAAFVVVLAAARRRLRRHAQPELGRRQRLPAARARAPRRRGARPRAHGAVRALQPARRGRRGARRARRRRSGVARRAAASSDARRVARDVRRSTARSALLVWLLYRRRPQPARDDAAERVAAGAARAVARASSSGSRRCSASTPSPAAWSSIRCWRSGCSSASACRSRRPARSSSGPAC